MDYTPSSTDWLDNGLAEKRIACDGVAYTFIQFERWYPTSAASLWADAKPEEGAIKHASPSGAPFAQLESPCSAAQPAQVGQSWYGAAARTKLEEQWHPRVSDTDARGPPASEATEHASQNSVPRRDDGDSAAQPAPPQEASAEQPAPSQEDAFAGVANAYVPAGVSQADIRARPFRIGFGGKEACRKQRELRTWCLDQLPVQYEYDLTNGDWSWQDVLRSHNEELLKEVLEGSSITSFSFRLLAHERDPNYIKKDSGERHVFELRRADGVAVQMHYHKNGKMDPPTVLRERRAPVRPGCAPAAQEASAAQPAPAQSSPTYELQPVATLADIKASPTNRSVPMGKNEVHTALLAILSHCFGEDAGAVNITDGKALEWRTWLKNFTQNREVVGEGIKQVFALKPQPFQRPCLALVRADDSCALVTVSNASVNLYENCDKIPCGDKNLLRSVRSTTIPWMQLRDKSSCGAAERHATSCSSQC